MYTTNGNVRRMRTPDANPVATLRQPCRSSFQYRTATVRPAGSPVTVNTAIGFGYYGAAKAIYGAFIAKGSDVALRANTPLVLRMDDEPALTATVTVPEKPAALDKNDTVAKLK